MYSLHQPYREIGFEDWIKSVTGLRSGIGLRSATKAPD